MHHGEWMVVIIIGMVLATRLYRDRCGIGGRNVRPRFDAMPPRPSDDAEARQLRDEVRSLKERIAVLERIATDHSTSLDREIESLRDRP
ncbi:hypothetical protein [uncultured Sphingomonas sp.]|jgi:hypothetical protein|uniref:hypothetical protein n=1 Tax=uncultured Sphingomonas sp. TaxID=158754 RepID=UPI00263614B0|nr:hypothetical protein [uncultured Sphingomonas sp.]